jgi:hypothetical protein
MKQTKGNNKKFPMYFFLRYINVWLIPYRQKVAQSDKIPGLNWDAISKASR